MYNQLAIAIFGVTAIFLSQQKNSELQRYGCIFGLAAQPFWFYTSYQSQQWGIFLVSICYAFAWAIGFKNNWLNRG